MKVTLAKNILLILSVFCILCVPVTPAYAEQHIASNVNAESGIPTPHIFLFAGGMVIAIGTLIVMQILKKKREKEAPDDDEDEE